jgi:type I restriction enzyme S subunit
LSMTKIIPKLRFKEFKDKWETNPLINLSVNGFSNGAFNDPKKVGSGYRIINVKDMYIDGTINIDTLTRVAIDEQEFSKNRVEYGDIFFTRSSLVKEGIAYSNVNLNDVPDLTYDGHLIRMRPNKEKHSPMFLYYSFSTSTARKQFIKRGKTATMTTIGQEDIAKVEITFPTLPEQQKIASFLSAIDEKIQQLTRKKELLEQYKKGVMQVLFSGKLRFKVENGKAYPKWEEKRLGDVAEFLKGKGISKLDIDDAGNTECIRYGQLYTDYKETISKVISRTRVDIKELVLSEANDVIIPASGETQIDIATASCVLRSGIALGGDLNIIRTKLSGVFLSYYLNTKKKVDIARLSQGITVVHLYPSQLGLLKLSIPCLDEQQQIASYLSSLDTKIESVATQITQNQTFKKGLLQQMFV